QDQERDGKGDRGRHAGRDKGGQDDGANGHSFLPGQLAAANQIVENLWRVAVECSQEPVSEYAQGPLPWVPERAKAQIWRQKNRVFTVRPHWDHPHIEIGVRPKTVASMLPVECVQEAVGRRHLAECSEHLRVNIWLAGYDDIPWGKCPR